MGAIVLFDGVCNFCNGFINYVIEHDKADYFKFAPLQSEIGEELLTSHGVDRSETDSVVLIEGDKIYTHSTAALRISRRLGGIWSLVYPLIIVPRPIRDLFYKTFARFRYRLFGRQDSCMMPTPEIRARFL